MSVFGLDWLDSVGSTGTSKVSAISFGMSGDASATSSETSGEVLSTLSVTGGEVSDAVLVRTSPRLLIFCCKTSIQASAFCMVIGGEMPRERNCDSTSGV